MEEKKIIVTKDEAIKKIVAKIKNNKIICVSGNGYRDDIENENFEMEISSSHYYSYSNEERNYDMINISIKTKEYPHIRRALKAFDIMNGNYSFLVEKINFIIQEDVKMKEVKKAKENKQDFNLKLLREKLQGLGAKKGTFCDSYHIKNKYLDISFYAYADKISVDIKEIDNLTLDQAIELIKKLQ